MFVPSVRENSTGVRVRKEELRRREESAVILRVPGTGVVSNEGLRVKARQGCGVAGWATRVGGLCYSKQQYTRDGGTSRIQISQRSPPRPLSWADGGVGEESGAKA